MQSSEPTRWTGATAYLDLDHPLIVRAASAAAARASARERAQAVFAVVRDRVRFGFRPAFYALKASDVLRGGVGFCNNQSTLMVALLRRVGIPARAHYVDIHAEVLSGVLDPRTPYVDHSWTEAWIDGAWRATDAYIVDPPLLKAAKARLRKARRPLGYGAHVNGVDVWDGRTAAFSQFVDDGSCPRLSTRDYGVFHDAGDFYAAPGQRWNRRNPVMTLALAATVGEVNRRLDELRREPARP